MASNKNKYVLMSALLVAALIFTILGYRNRINPNAGKLYYHSSAGDIPASSIRGVGGAPATSGQPFVAQNDHTTFYLELFLTIAILSVGINEIKKDKKKPKSKAAKRRS